VVVVAGVGTEPWAVVCAVVAAVVGVVAWVRREHAVEVAYDLGVRHGARQARLSVSVPEDALVVSEDDGAGRHPRRP